MGLYFFLMTPVVLDFGRRWKVVRVVYATDPTKVPLSGSNRSITVARPIASQRY